MYANPNHLEILTLLLSRILKVDYKDIEGKITLEPLSIPNKKIGEKKTERDVVVSVKSTDKYKIILEVNVRKKFYQSIMDRNIFYKNEVASNGIYEGDDYSNLPITILVNFNTFYVDKVHEKIFDEYLLRNEEGYILTKREKVLNIHIVKCKDLWYHNEYQGMFEPIEEDLMLLCAAMVVDKHEDFIKILEEVRTRPEIKELMEVVLTDMNSNQEMYARYNDWKEEEQKITRSIIAEEREDAIKSNQQEIVMNMYKDNCSLELISKYTNLTIDEIKKIINEFNS